MKKFIRQEVLSFKYAFNGVRLLFKERHFRVHLVLAVIVVILGLVKQLDLMEWVAIIICISIVLAAEAANTAMEKLVDYVSLENNPQAKKIKDIGAGMVLITAIGSAIVGSIIFIF